METTLLLEKLITIPSPLGQEKAISEYLGWYAKNIGFTVKKVKTAKNRTNIVATYGKAKQYLGFYGHMDTIPPDNNKKNPYDFTIKKDIGYGLGVEDMKGGITAILQAGAYAVQNKLPVKMIFGVDEEGISQGAHDLVNAHLLDDISFLIVGESGQAQKSLQKFNVCYGRKGRILYEAIITGKKAHAAEFDRGINAVEKSAEFIQILNKMSFQKHPHLGKTKVVIHSIHSETDSFSVPDKAVILFSLLTTPNVTSKNVLKALQEQAKRKDIVVAIKDVPRKTPYGESYEVDRKNIFLNRIEKNVFKQYKVKPVYATSVADENIFANRLRIPVISLGPFGGGGHTVNEWVNLDSLTLVEDVYKHIIRLYNLEA